MVIRGKTSTMYINITSGQPSHHSPDDGGGDGLRNVGLLFTTDKVCYPRRFYQFQSPWKFQVLYFMSPVVSHELDEFTWHSHTLFLQIKCNIIPPSDHLPSTSCLPSDFFPSDEWIRTPLLLFITYDLPGWLLRRNHPCRPEILWVSPAVLPTNPSQSPLILCTPDS
jgi:hypothetical protein